MARLMKTAALGCTALFILFAAAAHCFEAAFWLPLAITFGTAAYHLLMRFAVGFAVNAAMHNRADVNKRRYRCHPFEKKLYRLLGVKRWKAALPSYDPSLFSPEQHSWAEIAKPCARQKRYTQLLRCLAFCRCSFRFAGALCPYFLLHLCLQRDLICCL